MSVDKMGQTADLTTAGSTRWNTAAGKRERNFYIALACAALLHASALVGFAAREPAAVGDPSGANDAISVSLVTEQDLQNRSSAIEPPKPPPGPPPTEAQPPQLPPPKPEAQKPPEPKPPEPQEQPQEQPPEQPPDQPEAKVEPDPKPPVPDAKPDVEKPEEAKVAKADDQKVEEQVQDLLSLPDENPTDMLSGTKPKSVQKPTPDTSKTNPPKSSQAKPQKKPQKQQKTAALDLSEPQARVSSFSGSGEAAFQRPPGITRSGLNDAFARAVIRALQQSMPQLTDTLGRVQVRILLSENGNVVEVALVRGAKDSILNQNVVFAAKQTSYPIPPVGSNLADRTFLVTYIYD